jgi:hypothetical protein
MTSLAHCPARDPRSPRDCWAEIGSDRSRFEDPTALQCLARTAPLSYQSGKIHKVYLRRHCNKLLRHAVHLWANLSRKSCPWAAVYYEQLPTRGKSHAWRPTLPRSTLAKNPLENVATGTRYDAELHARNQLKHSSWVLKIQHA